MSASAGFGPPVSAFGSSGSGGGGGGAVNSVTAGAGLVNNGTSGDPIIDFVSGDTSLTVSANSVVVNTAVIAAKSYVDGLFAAAALAATLLTAGAGLTGGGTLAADRTFNVVANADGSMVVNADDIQVGILASDAQHGNRGGGGIHAVAVASGAAGFLSGADKAKLDGVAASAAAVGAVTPSTVSLTAPAIGASATAARSDHSHDLSLAIVPAWTGAHTWSTTTVPVQSTITDSSAATQLEAARFRHHSSVNATAGISAYASFWASNGAQTDREVARVHGLLSTVTDTSEQGAIQFNVITNGVAATIVAHMVGGQVNATSGLGIKTLSATGGTTGLVWNLSASSALMKYDSQSASNGGHQFTGTVNTSGARSFFVILPSANTATTLSTAVKGFDYQTYTRQWATGAGPAEQIEFNISAPTYSAVGASVFPIATTFSISGAPIASTNMTITKGLAFHVLAGGSQFDGNVGFYGTSPVAQGTGGQNVTNTVTDTGSTNGTIPDITNGTVYATDYPNLRNALFQLARMLKQDHDQMRALGFLT